MSTDPIQYPYIKVLRADGTDYVDDDDHNKQELQLEALTERVGGTWDTAGRPAPSAEVPFPLGFNTDIPGYEEWNGVAWIPLGNAGLREPGLMKYIDPDLIYEGGGPGFSVGLPAALIATRALTVNEQIILLMESLAPEPNLVATQAAAVPSPGGGFQIDFYFSPGGPLYFPYYYTDRAMAVVGIWDTVLAAWIDKMCVRVERLVLPP
jgi:hypothetical protein